MRLEPDVRSERPGYEFCTAKDESLAARHMYAHRKPGWVRGLRTECASCSVNLQSQQNKAVTKSTRDGAVGR
jgi:hypothetical protein